MGKNISGDVNHYIRGVPPGQWGPQQKVEGHESNMIKYAYSNLVDIPNPCMLLVERKGMSHHDFHPCADWIQAATWNTDTGGLRLVVEGGPVKRFMSWRCDPFKQHLDGSWCSEYWLLLGRWVSLQNACWSWPWSVLNIMNHYHWMYWYLDMQSGTLWVCVFQWCILSVVLSLRIRCPPSLRHFPQGWKGAS